MRSPFRVVIHGSLRKHLREMSEAALAFEHAGIEVLAPQISDIVKDDEGFLFFRGEERLDPRLIELMYLKSLRELGDAGFSYFVNPGGYIGKSASYELGIAQASNVPCFFMATPSDHPAYIGERAVWTPRELAAFIVVKNRLPTRSPAEPTKMDRLWRQIITPGSVVTTGAIIEYKNQRTDEREVLMVRTHKWQNRFSIVGGKVRRRERLHDALLREVKEETGLDGLVGRHLCTFDQIKNSGYYEPWTHHVFVDNVVRVDSKRVVLNEEAQEYVWLPIREALRSLPIEPNARHTLELYAKSDR